MGSPFLEVFKNRRDVTLGDTVSGCGGGELGSGLMVILIFSSLSDAMNW